MLRSIPDLSPHGIVKTRDAPREAAELVGIETTASERQQQSLSAKAGTTPP